MSSVSSLSSAHTASAEVRVNPARCCPARASKSEVASLTANGCTENKRSPATPRPSRDVVSTLTPGQWETTPRATMAAPSEDVLAVVQYQQTLLVTEGS